MWFNRVNRNLKLALDDQDEGLGFKIVARN